MPVHLWKTDFSGQRLIDVHFVPEQRRLDAVMFEFQGDLIACLGVTPDIDV